MLPFYYSVFSSSSFEVSPANLVLVLEPISSTTFRASSNSKRIVHGFTKENDEEKNSSKQI